MKNLVGSQTDACIDAKAMQSRMLFMFAFYLLGKLLPKFKGESRLTALGLWKSARCLRDWYRILNSHGPKVPTDKCDEAIVLAKKHATLWVAHTGCNAKPTHHALVDMSKAMYRTGNPKDFSTYADETMNSTIARIARSVHPRRFAISVLKNITSNGI